MIAALILAAAGFTPNSVSCTPLTTCTFWSDGTPQVSPCATPTPTIQWDQVVDFDLKGYRVYVDGVLLVDFPCELHDDDDDGIPETRWCRGADFGIPLQRYCGFCLGDTSYTITVKAYDEMGGESPTFSAPLNVCVSRTCQAPGPCN